MTKLITVKIIQEHINNGARRGKGHNRNWPHNQCPIQLALKEMGYRSSIGRIGYSVEKDYNKIGGNLPDIAADFVCKFDDIGRDVVQPFEFELEVPE